VLRIHSLFDLELLIEKKVTTLEFSLENPTLCYE